MKWRQILYNAYNGKPPLQPKNKTNKLHLTNKLKRNQEATKKIQLRQNHKMTATKFNKRKTIPEISSILKKANTKHIPTMNAKSQKTLWT